MVSSTHPELIPGAVEQLEYIGPTLRDQFAMAALQGIIIADETPPPQDPGSDAYEYDAERAYAYAYAMMVEREW